MASGMAGSIKKSPGAEAGVRSRKNSLVECRRLHGTGSFFVECVACRYQHTKLDFFVDEVAERGAKMLEVECKRRNGASLFLWRSA